MADAPQIQPLVKSLMRTLLVDYPTLLDESDKSRLASRKACQEMGLTISYPVLVAEGDPGHDRKRFYVDTYGDWYVCSQWQQSNHRSNAESLLNFVEDLISRKTAHPDVSQLERHREAFKGFPASDGQRPRTPKPDVLGDPAPPSPRAIAHPRNQILYGPPGTGKTYSTVEHSLTIISSGGTGDAGIKSLVAELGEERAQTVATLHRSFVSEGRIAMVTFHQNYAYEDFVEGIRPRLADANGGDQTGDSAGTQGSQGIGYELRPGIFRKICRAAEEERRAAKDESRTPERFVLIIDEINRGNIPKIFGELITLIEESRRLGGPDETTVTLPYSGDDFGVPENLYIIGTMNTADRSIQQLDTALRRRFTFVEMMPDPEHKLISEDVEGVNCRQMLRAMNERIAVLMDREHQIGHTYLFNVKDLDDLSSRFRNRIFPLLQEYFYDDWKKIRAVLGGNAFVQERKIGEGHTKDLAQESDFMDEELAIYERLPEDNPAWKDAGQYRQIYESADAG